MKGKKTKNNYFASTTTTPTTRITTTRITTPTPPATPPATPPSTPTTPTKMNHIVEQAGLQGAGSVCAVRGAGAPLDKLRCIYAHSHLAGIVVLQGPKL
jgi:hypothetical protein